MKFDMYHDPDPDNERWFYGFKGTDVLVDITSLRPLDSKQIKELLNTVYAQRDFNGVRTTPGRDAGILLNSFNNIPIIQDGNLNFDYTKKKVSSVKMGDIFLLDLKHIWMSMLTPVQMFNINNPAITRALQERNVMNSRMEVRIDKFIGHCRIRGIADDA